MLCINDTVAGNAIRFFYVQNSVDMQRVATFVKQHHGRLLAIDTESTSFRCYLPEWELRTVQIGNANVSFVIPAKYRKLIDWIMRQPVKWLGHNGPHDIRSIDQHLGYATGVVCYGETFIPAHHMDSRNQQDGGVGHGLKELSCAYIDPDAGKWERELKRIFKTLRVPIPGEFYKSGPNKGKQKTRVAHLAEGWALIDPTHPAYIAYAASDPVLTFRLWRVLRTQVSMNPKLYAFDMRVQQACDTLHRRGMAVDVPYLLQLRKAYVRVEEQTMRIITRYGCENPQSTAQLAQVLDRYGFEITERTPTGKPRVDASVLRAAANSDDPALAEFAGAVLLLKQVSKRRHAYVEGILNVLDAGQRLHPSIKPLAARTARMSVSDPALQQLPTKDNEGDERFIIDETIDLDWSAA